MFKTLIVPVDGTDASTRAVDVAGDLAVRHGARMLLLHIADEDPAGEDLARFARVEGMTDPAGGGYVEPIIAGPPHAVVGRPRLVREHVDNRAAAAALSARILEEARSRACACGVERVDVMTLDGDPVDRILECARGEKADAIVMGSRGMSDIKGAFVGSVSHQVAHGADCTCITVT